jgi:glucose/arabinose dehydrogenase
MKRIAWMLCVCALLSCEDDSSKPDGGGVGGHEYAVVNAFPSLTFSRPTDIQNAGDGSDRLFVTEQTGHIRVFANESSVASSAEFLDISSQVLYQSYGEMGLLVLAFHPDYETNGFFFVAYTTGSPRRGRVSRFQVSGDPNVADPASEKILLEFADDYANHNGGGMCFGADGYLYISVGDEGGGGDPDDNAQDRASIFGKILRIDVDQNVDTVPYHGIPGDNPYAGNTAGYREDIWAYGLRNAWRISFDAPSGRLIAGDVGQSTYEEIDIIEKGGNYGWDCREGTIDYDEDEDPSSPLCASATGLVEPVFVYPRSDGESITGGYVYRGPTVTSLTGLYVYGDYEVGRVWALDLTTGANVLLEATGLLVSTFGVAENGELFIAAYDGGGSGTGVYRLERTGAP